MSVKYYLCKVYGSGGDEPQPWTSTTGPWRAAIQDVLDPDTGAKAFQVRRLLKVVNNQPVKAYVVCAAKGDKHRLVEGNPDIDFMGEPGIREVKLSALDVMTKNDTLSKATARGVDVSGFDSAASVRSLVTKVVADHEPALTVDDLDFPD